METTFNKSDSIKNLTKALLVFSLKIGKIKKENSNPFFHSLYADLPAIQEAIAEPLQESGLVVLQIPDGEGLVTMIAHAESGEYIMANGLMKPVKNDPQSMGSATTYQRRYSIAALLNLNIDKDDDGNAASTQTPKQQAAPTKTELQKAIEEINGAKSVADLTAIKAKYSKDIVENDAFLKAGKAKYDKLQKA